MTKENVKQTLWTLLAAIVLVGACVFLSYGIGVIFLHGDVGRQEKLFEDKYGTYADGYFIIDEKWEQFKREYKIVHAKDTGVMYFIERSKDGASSITPLYNSDGTIMTVDRGKEFKEKIETTVNQLKEQIKTTTNQLRGRKEC